MDRKNINRCYKKRRVWQDAVALYVELIPHFCKSRFCPTCGKHATDVWANQLLNNLLDVAYHHLIMAIPWSAVADAS